MMTIFRKASLVIFLALITLGLQAQNNIIQLSIEYYNQGEYQKAVEYFEELAKNDKNIPVIYEKYLESLLKLNEEKEARQLLRKLNKRFPENVVYQVDEIFLERNFGDQKKFDEQFDEFIETYTKENDNLRDVSNILLKKREYQLAEKLFLTARKNKKNDYAYVQDLLTVYRSSGNENGVIRESLNLLKLNPQNINYAQNILQSFITIDNYEKLEIELIRLMQKDNQGTYNEMLIWMYIQIKQFDKAFAQARALDKRFDLMGSELLNLGQICFKNKDYQTAVNIYEYIIEKYPKSVNYAFAKQKLIETREEIVKNTFPVDLAQIKILINEYDVLVKELGFRRNTAEAMRKMALLYAFYLDEHDTAISILSEAIKIPRTSYDFIGSCKLSLGDIYLLKNEPWESTLLYAQVDKSYKDQPTGHIAKLKLAKLYFYEGNFELAQSNLDILKLATSREIANDAMDLSLLIQDNLALDTSGEALYEFAKIDLLTFQKKFDTALISYNRLLIDFPNHSLSDEIFWNMAEINIRIGNISDAVDNLDNILNLYKDDIYGDDALFLKADLFENYLEREEEAMEIYKEILFQYPGSIYNAEARKRFRSLRGDYQ